MPNLPNDPTLDNFYSRLVAALAAAGLRVVITNPESADTPVGARVLADRLALPEAVAVGCYVRPKADMPNGLRRDTFYRVAILGDGILSLRTPGLEGANGVAYSAYLDDVELVAGPDGRAAAVGSTILETIHGTLMQTADPFEAVRPLLAIARQRQGAASAARAAAREARLAFDAATEALVRAQSDAATLIADAHASLGEARTRLEAAREEEAVAHGSAQQAALALEDGIESVTEDDVVLVDAAPGELPAPLAAFRTRRKISPASVAIGPVDPPERQTPASVSAPKP